MPTFNSGSTAFADQFVPAANETWSILASTTVNIVGDYINASGDNAFAGTTTITEGSFNLRGDLAWEIGVANTTNATVGLAVTGGTSGATAVITQLLTAPTRIKFRYTNNSTFANGETISGSSFSAAANTAPSRSTILFAINAAGNNLNLQKLGAVSSKGVWRTIGTATGLANQTITSVFNCLHAGVWVQRAGSATLTNASNQITVQHEWAVGQVVEFATSGSLSGTGFSVGTKYYVVASDWSGLTGQFGTYVSLSTTKAGSAITATGAGSGLISLLMSGPTITFTNGSSTITAPDGHSFAVGDSLTLSTTSTLATNFDDITTYYVLSSNTVAGTFTLSSDYSLLTGTGTAIVAGSAGSGTHSTIPDDNYFIWLNLNDRNLTGSTAVIGTDINHGCFFKQANGSTTLTFGDEGAAAAFNVSSFSGTTINTAAAHGRSVGDVIRLSTTGTLSNASAGTDYYVLTVPSSTSLTIAVNVGSTALNLSASTGTTTITPQIGGRAPRYGAKIRIPNVALCLTNAANAPTPVVGTTFGGFSNALGAFNFDKLLTSNYQFSINNAVSVSFKFCTIHNQFIGITIALILQDIAISTSSTDTISPGIFTSCVSYVKNLHVESNTNVAGQNVTFTNPLATTVVGGLNILMVRGNSNVTTLAISGLASSVTITRMRCIGGQYLLASNCQLLNSFHSDSPLRGLYSANAQQSVNMQAPLNSLVDQLQIGAAPRNAIVTITTASNNFLVRRLGTSASPMDLLGNTNALLNGASSDG
jgi:hypothetical protein